VGYQDLARHFKASKEKKQHLSKIAKCFSDSQKEEAQRLLKLTKFCFAYFDDSQELAQSFADWQREELLTKLNEKLIEFSKEPLSHWLRQKCTDKSTIFRIYDDFSFSDSSFRQPKHVPENIRWAAFRLQNLPRVVGFVLPDDDESWSNYPGLDKNTFYVVFLDKDHKFYSPG